MSMSIQVVSGITLLGVMGAGYFLIKYVGKNKESEKEIADTRYNQPQEKIKITKDEAEDYLLKADINKDVRAEALSIEDWIRLTRIVYR